MFISTKGRYALRVLIDMAEHSGNEYIKLKDIAERQEISEKYLESIVRQLVVRNIVVGLRGKGGGYKLTRKPNEYSIGEIIELLEGSLAPVACLSDGAEECPREGVCKTFPMWTEFYLLERDFFYGKKLSDIVNS